MVISKQEKEFSGEENLGNHKKCASLNGDGNVF